MAVFDHREELARCVLTRNYLWLAIGMNAKSKVLFPGFQDNPQFVAVRFILLNKCSILHEKFIII